MGDSPKYYPPPYHHSNRETSLFNRIKSFKKLFHNILTNKTHPTSYSTLNSFFKRKMYRSIISIHICTYLRSVCSNTLSSASKIHLT